MRTDFDSNRAAPQHGRLTSIAVDAYHRIQQGLDWWEEHRLWPATEPATIPDETDGRCHSRPKLTA